MSDLFGFINDLEKIIYGLGFKLILKRNNNDRALFRDNANPGAVGNDGNIEIRDISWCLPSIDPSNVMRIIVQKGLSKKNNVDFSYYERKTFYKNVPNATKFLFDLGMENGRERPQYIIVGFENNNVNVSDNDNDLRSSFANNDCDIVIDKDLQSSIANNDNVNDNDNDNVNDNDLRSSFANNENDNDNDRVILYIREPASQIY